MPHHDRFGLALTTRSDAAAAAYREGLDLFLAAWPGAADAFDRSIAADPEFALPRAARARLHLMFGDTATARREVAVARACVALSGQDREKSHVDILGLGIDGRPSDALPRALEHLETWPCDALVMSLPLGAFGLFAFSGRPDHDQARVDLCERHARHYGDDWWLLTHLGWSHTENGNVVAGRDITERAFAIRRANANAVHALAHAMFEQGATNDAGSLIEDWLPSYDRTGLLHAHISWHQALLALDEGDGARALAIYRDRIRPVRTSAAPINAVTDSVSMLWRLALYGHDVPRDIWTDAAGYANQWFPNPGNAFVDVHMAMLAAANGELDGLAQRVAALETRLAAGTLAPGAVVPAICRAVRQFAEGDYAACARTLEPLERDLVRIGGSHAQREVIEDTLLVAWMKSGELTKARALIDSRLHRRPSPRDQQWRAQI